MTARCRCCDSPNRARIELAISKRVSALELDQRALTAALSREVVSVGERRALIQYWREAFGLSERRACRLAGIDGSGSYRSSEATATS